MPSSTVRQFDDPDDYARAMRAIRSEMTIIGKGQFAASLTRVDLHDLWMQRFDDNVPRILRSVPEDWRVIISFRTRPGSGLFWEGLEIQPSSLVCHPVGQETCQRSEGNASWASMSLPPEKMGFLQHPLWGCDQTRARRTALVKIAPGAMAKLRRLHLAGALLANDAPAVIKEPETARGLEQALVNALAECLGAAESDPEAAARYRHDAIMRKFHAAIEECCEGVVYVPEICATIGIPQRTLHMCCSESLGIGPKRYLLLRRMNLARKALRAADAAAVTVTQIATQFGFWNFGRFSVEYRSLFGEMPSATLRTSQAHRN